jgi:RNA polymerase sigma-70 factor (ECF subfamily)
LADIRSGKEGRDRVLIQLYKDKKLRQGVINVVRKLRGTPEDFEDVFSTTLMQFVKTVINRPELTIRHQLNTYIISIAKYICIAQKKKSNKNLNLNYDMNTEFDFEESPESLVLNKEKIHLLHEVISSLGDKCKAVLMYWANGYRMKEIAKLMSYKSENMAKKKKYKCFKTLLIMIEKNPKIKSALR